MKTKSIMLIAVSLGFGLIAAIGMSQVLGQKSTDTAPEVEMVQIYVASKSLDIGDELKLDENLNVKKRPVTDIPENAIRSAEELEGMIAIQKVPKDVLIVADYIMEKHLAGLGKQPPKGYRAFTLKTELVDTHHNSVQAGDRIDICGVFRVRTKDGKEMKAPSTFLKNIEVWQVNDKDYIGVDGEDNERISTITVLLTPKQVELAILAQDIASMVRIVKTNREDGASDEEDFDLESLTDMFNGPREEEKDPEKVDETQQANKAKSQELIEDLNKDVVKETPKQKKEFKHKMTIYKGGQVIKYGFSDNNELPTVIAQTVSGADSQGDLDPGVTEGDLTGNDDQQGSDDSSDTDKSDGKTEPNENSLDQ